MRRRVPMCGPRRRAEVARRRKEVRVYEAIVRGLESVGVDTAFGGNGENSLASRSLWSTRGKSGRS